MRPAWTWRFSRFSRPFHSVPLSPQLTVTSRHASSHHDACWTRPAQATLKAPGPWKVSSRLEAKKVEALCGVGTSRLEDRCFNAALGVPISCKAVWISELVVDREGDSKAERERRRWKALMNESHPSSSGLVLYHQLRIRRPSRCGRNLGCKPGLFVLAISPQQRRRFDRFRADWSRPFGDRANNP